MTGRGGRGRGGRGRGGPVQSYMKDELQLTPAEIGVIQPPPLYPPLEYQPQPLPLGAEYQSRMKSSIDASSSSSPPFRFFRELLAENWKKEMRYLFKDEKKKDIERYTDRYEELPVTPHRNYEIDLSRIPRELHPSRKRPRKAGLNLPRKRRAQEDEATLINTLEELEKKEQMDAEHDEVDEDEEKRRKKEGGEEEEEEEEEGDEDNESDYEDDNDYVDNYFDNGEDYGDASDGSGVEAVF